MNLLGIRTQFITISGRYDLVSNVTTFADNGANFYINMAQRSLERRIGVGGTVGKVFLDITAGTYKIKFKDCRAIQAVWVMNSESRIPVEILDTNKLKAMHQKFTDNMYTSPLSSMTPSRPSFCYPTNFRRSPDNTTPLTDSATLQSYIDTISPYDPSYTGIILLPPADGDYGVEINGLFYNHKLSGDTEENFWTVEHPDLLIMAALRHLEIMYRGSKSATSWDALIEAELVNLEKDSIEQDVSQIDQMNG